MGEKIANNDTVLRSHCIEICSSTCAALYVESVEHTAASLIMKMYTRSPEPIFFLGQ